MQDNFETKILDLIKGGGDWNGDVSLKRLSKSKPVPKCRIWEFEKQ